MTKQWIVTAVILGILFAGVGVVWLLGHLKLRRIRTLTCPDCHTPFAVASLASVRRWMEFDAERGKVKASGFYLRCTQCSADYRFLDDLRPLGRAEQKAETT